MDSGYPQNTQSVHLDTVMDKLSCNTVSSSVLRCILYFIKTISDVGYSKLHRDPDPHIDNQ